jgi:hypothetical protein
MDSTKIGLVVLTTVFGSILLIILIILIVYLSRYNTFYGASRVAIDNNEFCNSQEGMCRLSVVEDLFQPVDVEDGKFEYPTARFCADLVARIELLFYQTNGLTELTMPPNLEHRVSLYFKDKIIGYVASSKISSLAWVAFRGTANEQEWRQDFNFSQSNLDLNDTDEQRTFSLKTGEILSCHKGFLDVFSEFKKDLVRTIKEINPNKVIITGHSLGASLATLASLELSSENFQVYTYAFASPRVCDFIPDSNLASFWRLNNTTDVITNIPLSVMPNIHNKNKPFIYTHGGKTMEFTNNRLSLTNNHLMPVFIHALDNFSYS